jgi:RNA recognition motif-containing protein
VSTKLYVGNLAFTTTADDLRAAFAPHGPVDSAQVASDRGTGQSRGFAFVEMASGAEQAIAALNGAELHGRRLTVNEAKPREERGRSGGSGGYGGGRPGGGSGRRY